MAELLVWPALIAYGEAAFAYAGELRGPGLAGRAATWGVRVGWLAQTALLVVQLLDSDGFPWGTWAGALNLFVWLVVTAYLIWGCKPRYRLLGLAVMPPAAVLLLAAWAGGGTGVEKGDRAGVLLAVHAGLMLAGLAGLHAGRGHGRGLRLAGPAAQAPRSDPAALAGAAPRVARPPLVAGRARRARPARRRDRRRARQLRVGRFRPGHGSDARRLRGLRRPAARSGTRPACTAPGSPASRF